MEGAYFGDLEINYSRLFDSYFRKMDRTDIVKRERVKLIENGDCVSVPRKYFRDSYANSLKPSVSKPFGTVNVCGSAVLSLPTLSLLIVTFKNSKIK